MAAFIGRADVYVGDDLTWQRAAVQFDRGRLRVRVDGKPVLRLGDAALVERRRSGREVVRTFTGTDEDTGEAVTISAVKADCGCSGR